MEYPGSRLIADHRPPCTLMVPGMCKIHRRCKCNVLKIPVKSLPVRVLCENVKQSLLQGPKLRDQSSPNNPLRGDSQNIGYSPLRSSSLTLNPTYLPTYTGKHFSGELAHFRDNFFVKLVKIKKQCTFVCFLFWFLTFMKTRKQTRYFVHIVKLHRLA